MTITFLTLFFGLVSGPVPVEMAVSAPVVAVELTVDDGAPVRLGAPPWKTTLDFGDALIPHRVVARALDEQGHELARTEEWANFPYPLAKAEIVLEAEKGGAPRAARVAWTDVMAEEPESISLTFDGKPLKLDKAGRAELPAHDLKTIHILTAEVRFKSDRTAHKDVAYGGEYGSEVANELTAVPVRVPSGSLPPLRDLRGWFTAGGRELTVTALENGQAQLFIVRVPSSYEDTKKIGSRGLLAEDFQLEMRLDKDARIRFVPPVSERVEGADQDADLFHISGEATYDHGGLPFLIRGKDDTDKRKPRKYVQEKPVERELRVADAVAVAGLQAMAENRRRAILLVLKGDEVTDNSLYDPETVRRFLASIHVPLFVWTLGKPVPGSLAAAWGPSERVDRVMNLYRASAQVREELLSQRIVLVEGHHLPQSIALGPAAKGVELVRGTGATKR
ncbi:MAG TPA: hypothetical protein VF173_01390 [Thermoanaerobaculia bacterium]|nr:hypothetical protein [Thermoanaerobaculia bacterium]